MRLSGFLSVSTVLSLLITSASGLPANTLAITISTVAISTSIQSYLNNGRQASPDTSSSSSSEAAAEYASSKSSEEGCNCAERRSSLDDDSTMSPPTSATIAASFSISPAYFSSTFPTATHTPSNSQQAQATPKPQQVNLPDLGPTQYVGPPGLAPAVVPTTITPAASLPTKALEEDTGGQKWYQVTYWECVTWPSDYVHCGWHTPLRMGTNPDPNGETFVYSVGSGRRVQMGMLGAVVGVAVIAVVML